MKVELVELVGEYCLHKEQGRKLSLILESAMKMKESVTLDFFRIRLLNSDFMEGAFSKLLKTYKRQNVLSGIKLEGIKPDMKKSFNFNVELFSRYHNDKEFKEKIDLYFNPEEITCKIKDLEVFPIEQTINKKIDAEEPLYIVERMDVQPIDRPTSCSGNIPS